MRIFEDLWANVVYIINIVTLSPWSSKLTPQPSLAEVASGSHRQQYNDSPIFQPPAGPEGFTCDYTAMGPEWRSCSTPDNRECWITNGTFQYNITTNYEDPTSAGTPTGTLRRYYLEAANMTLNADGFINEYGQVFNQAFPGPWLHACWGDTLEITVKNSLPYNGTTVHWHGIRQLNTMEMDGVNGVTQCPIAPNEKFVYRFNVTQYGTSWYHSHYSLQYANGLLGPLTLHGPSSAGYDQAIDPILMQDYDHRSAFQDFYEEVTPGMGPTTMTNILLNGTGRYNCTEAEKRAGNCEPPPPLYSMTFKKGVRYLLRLINTSSESIFIFTIDNHNLKVIGSDFVPIKPYTTNSLRIGIGQRYHVVVEANQPTADQSYWIRTIVADNCGRFNENPDYRTGILYYGDSSNIGLPITKQAVFSTQCQDEPYDKLIPIVPWTVGKPSNAEGLSAIDAGLDSPFDPYDKDAPPVGDWSRWELGSQPLWLNFSDPAIMNVKNQNWKPPSSYVVVPQAVKGWIYLLITSTALPYVVPARNYVPAAHPIHLHGHDFAILQQSTSGYWPGLIKLNKINPPRRDVALLPGGGYLVIAFKADNPGSWLMHCHIAWHASSGLAVQILENQQKIEQTLSDSTSAFANAEDTCNKWNAWFNNKSNWYNKSMPFQDDSGI